MNAPQHPMPVDLADDLEESSGQSLGELVAVLRQRLKLLIVGPLSFGLLVLGISFLIPPTFTAKVTFIPPQQSQSGAAAALASLGSLASLAGGAGGSRNQAELYTSLLQSVTVADRVIDEFKLIDAYDSDYRVDARNKLSKNTRVTLGRKDGLITVEVDDRSPQRAADMANRYVDELRRVTATLAVSEAQQRRMFFEQQLKISHERLVTAQEALQSGGFNAGAIMAEPKAAAEGYARLKSEITRSQVRLEAMRGSLTDSTPEMRQQLAALAAMRQQLAQMEQTSDTKGGPDYVSRLREFKYQEAMFELNARQFELARIDESREGAHIQVVDTAAPPERKSHPKRALIAIAATVVAAVVLCAWVLLRSRRSA